MDAQALAQSERMWAVHVNSATVIANALVPHMRAQRDGRIVLIGSRVASGFPGRGQYAASKAALIALARSWAAELIADGVTVNVISPAATATPMLDDARRASSSPQIPPIGRLIEPSEIAAAVEYFLSTAAGAVTGQNLNVCGGASLQQ
jgi:NAD(P)-dependent dehydrogenase (short-subunit alcohol dehydrogenase family)